ncbi:hypothetical protein ACFSC4_09805 [Deinococcus malanensis]|nr:hypothetical protein [Deinococcus malanensis]
MTNPLPTEPTAPSLNLRVIRDTAANRALRDLLLSLAGTPATPAASR